MNTLYLMAFERITNPFGTLVPIYAGFFCSANLNCCLLWETAILVVTPKTSKRLKMIIKNTHFIAFKV